MYDSQMPEEGTRPVGEGQPSSPGHWRAAGRPVVYKLVGAEVTGCSRASLSGVVVKGALGEAEREPGALSSGPSWACGLWHERDGHAVRPPGQQLRQQWGFSSHRGCRPPCAPLLHLLV